jgi:hypothetical protein
MIIARTITTEDEWESLPVGTLARVGFIEHDDDGNETEGGTMTILRVAGDYQATAGDCMLAGGRYWSEAWIWEQGATALDTATIPEPDWPGAPKDPAAETAEAAVDAAIAGHAKRVEAFNKTPYSEYVKLGPEAHPAPTPARDIVEALSDLGWAPPAAYPEGVQVWTISGIPDGGRSDGTQAYLSLPAGDPDKQLRSDIWLDQPTVSVNFELPARSANY